MPEGEENVVLVTASGMLCNSQKTWILRTATEIFREVNLKTDKNGWNWARKEKQLYYVD